MEVENIGSRVIELPVRKFSRAPVAALHLLGDVDSEEFLAQILEAVPLGEGPHQAGRDLGAVDRRHDDTHVVADCREIEPGEVKDLQGARVCQESAQPRCREVAPGELHEMGIAVAAGELNEAQTVAQGLEAHGLGVDSDRGPEIKAGGKISLIEKVGHVTAKVEESWPATPANPVRHRIGRRSGHEKATRTCPREQGRAALVPRRRLELPRGLPHRYLKPARLPIPPPGHGASPSGRRGNLSSGNTLEGN